MTSRNRTIPTTLATLGILALAAFVGAGTAEASQTSDYCQMHAERCNPGHHECRYYYSHFWGRYSRCYWVSNN